MLRKDERFSVLTDKETLNKLNFFWRKNKFHSRNDAINYILKNYLDNELTFPNIEEIKKEIETNVKQTYLIKSLLEQIYVNMMFHKNENRYNDKNLEEFYKNMRINKYKFFD